MSDASAPMAQFFTDDQRPDLVRRYVDEAEDVWPTHMQFVYHDPVCEAFWPRLKEEFPAYQFIVYDDSEDRFLAQGRWRAPRGSAWSCCNT